MLGIGYVILLWHSLSLPYNLFEELEFPMLHAKFKFQDHKTVLENEIFKGFLPYMGMTAILVM